MWFGILSIYYVCKGPNYAYACVMKYVKHFWVGTQIILEKLINTMFDNVLIDTGSVIMMALLFDTLNDMMQKHGMYALANGLNNEGAWYDGQKYGNSMIIRVSEDTYTGA